MSTNTISIITPCLNRAEYIGQAIESVLAQNHPEAEHIIVDGGSSDGTLEVLARYPHLTVVTGRDQGMYDALNRGLEIASGDVVGFLNSDDLYIPNMFDSILPFFENIAEPQAVIGRALIFKQSWQNPSSFMALDFNKSLLEDISLGGTAVMNAWFFGKQVFERIGKFDPNLKIAGDREFCLRYALSGMKVSEFPAVVYCYREHEDSLTFNESPYRNLQAGEETLQFIQGYLHEHKIQTKHIALFKKWQNEQLLTLARVSFRHGLWLNLSRFLMQGIFADWRFPILAIQRLLD
jgi:glycosyltransferase involved in cell wall biosynthesis